MSNPEIMFHNNESRWANVGLRALVSTAAHPFEYAKVLIQIGYEPIPPRAATNIFGKPTLKLPNIFEYVKHIRSVDGFGGLYVGLAPKLCGNVLSSIVAQRCTDYLLLPENQDLEFEEEETEETRKKKCVAAMKCDVMSRTAAILISQPFHVITVRMMAQFVGKETKYVGVFGSIKEIYQQNGVLGFFSGLVPRVLGDILAIILAGGLTYTVNRYLVEDKEFKVFTAASMNFIATAVMYPFQVVSHCMAVTNSGLLIGSPTYMPHYNSWIDCWMDLAKTNQLKRGSSLLMRYYSGPHVVVAGKMLPVTVDQTLYPSFRS
ncbi:unnamed protein product [Ceutorhynchus assimilis]|uniref:Mitochondrial carrier homolog 2 n=1 Tax=Ceutorhynchus assimilis TaxID=467358 RepID=A0A9N9MHJ9_9CUCU|nr:unnamed protein product [Ceutorhynchus assimilis]